MRVLVTGGTGFVGGQVSRALLRAGAEVRVLSRTRKLSLSGVVPIRASLFEPQALADAVTGCDAVIHLVGIISEVGEQTFENVHVEGTRRILAAASAAGVSRFLHMSALGARASAPSRYHQTKWAAEELVRASGMAWSVFRPSLIYGPGDGVVTLFDRLSRYSPWVPVIGNGENRVQPVAVEDVARVFEKAVSSPTTVGRNYEVAGPESISFNALVRDILAALQRRRQVVHLPVPLARLQARILETLYPALLRQAPPLNREQIKMLGEDNVTESTAIWREFGIHPVDWKTGLNQLFHSRP